MEKLNQFNKKQIALVNNSVAMAEEVVSNTYKMSTSQWLHQKYDVKTLLNLSPNEIVHGPFAQIIRFKGKKDDVSLESAAYDFYKICLQDHNILSTMAAVPDLALFPFTLYIVAHELIHIVRFTKFLQHFDASPEERMTEEKRVHQQAHDILTDVRVQGMAPVLQFYGKWREPVDELLI